VIPYGSHTTKINDVIAVARQVWFKSLTQGPKIEEFERKVAKLVGARYAVAVSSATFGLDLSLKALELEKHTQVITTPISFVASSNCILYNDLIPHFVDIDPETLNISTKELANTLDSERDVTAIIPVHFAGSPCNMAEISQLAKVHDCRIIEDAAHAFGAVYETGDLVGSCKFSDLTVFSFHAVKSITTGEGGMITTNDEKLYKALLKLRSHGISKDEKTFQSEIYSTTNLKTNSWYYEMTNLGFHARMTEVQAALGISQLRYLKKFMRIRRILVKKYLLKLSNIEIVKPAQAVNHNLSGNHIFPIRIDFSKISLSRQELMNKLKERGIGTQVHYIPIQMQPFYAEKGYRAQDTPQALSYYFQCLTLPLFPKLRPWQQAKVVRILRELILENVI